MSDASHAFTPDSRSSRIIRQRMRHYARHGWADVAGWFNEEDVELARALLGFQLRRGVSGNVAEIGVHHGKSFLLLANGTRSDERAIALDVFDDQDKNVDRSGKGDRGIFEANVQLWAPDAATEIIQASSLELAPKRARDRFGGIRFFSIDGGHTAEITAHDLRLAEASLVAGGLVMLDDILNPHWTGVASGLAEYLRDGGGFIPFALSQNKLFLAASEEDALRYRRVCRSRKGDLLGKMNVEFFGHVVDVFGLGSKRRRDVAAESADKQARQSEQLESLGRRLSAATKRSKELERRVLALESSTSWRVTRPLRAASSLVRRRSGAP